MEAGYALAKTMAVLYRVWDSNPRYQRERLAS